MSTPSTGRAAPNPDLAWQGPVFNETQTDPIPQILIWLREGDMVVLRNGTSIRIFYATTEMPTRRVISIRFDLYQETHPKAFEAWTKRITEHFKECTCRQNGNTRRVLQSNTYIKNYYICVPSANFLNKGMTPP